MARGGAPHGGPAGLDRIGEVRGITGMHRPGTQDETEVVENPGPIRVIGRNGLGCVTQRADRRGEVGRLAAGRAREVLPERDVLEPIREGAGQVEEGPRIFRMTRGSGCDRGSHRVNGFGQVGRVADLLEPHPERVAEVGQAPAEARMTGRGGCHRGAQVVDRLGQVGELPGLEEQALECYGEVGKVQRAFRMPFERRLYRLALHLDCLADVRWRTEPFVPA